MSVILGFVFMAIVIGFGVRGKSKTAEILEVPLSTIDQKTVILKLR
ncbi:MAG: hypothetical protein WBD28_07125 [Candidatus Zixiibacteriota bacterium]